MSLVILPTFDLLTEHLTYDTLFEMFIPGGIKSVVRDAVFMTSFKEHNPYRDYARSLQSHHCALVDYVLKRFDEFMQVRTQLIYDEEHHLGTTRHSFEIGEYMTNLTELELVTNSIDDAVALMMQDLFRSKPYHISERDSYWAERDLIIGVEILPHRGKYRAL